MSQFIRDIINDPREYQPFLLLVGALVLIWGVLCISGLVSVLSSKSLRKFWFALAPCLFGWIGVSSKMPIHMQADDFQLTFDCRWLFLVPLLLGMAGLALWWRAKRKSKTEILLNQINADRQ